MLENPHTGDDLGCGGGRPVLQALFYRLDERGNAARAHILQAARTQRPGPGGQLAKLAVLVVASDGLDLRGIPVQTNRRQSQSWGTNTVPYVLRTHSTVRYLYTSVADPGCFSRIRLFSIPDPGSELSPSRIPDPDQRI